MERPRAYRSSIPPDATVRRVSRYEEEQGVIRLEWRRYFVGGKLVGERGYWGDGKLAQERPIRHGKVHGRCYQWDCSGVLVLLEPYQKGLMHGTARQWAEDGTLLGTYEMRHGTGLDVWRARREDGRVVVAEVHSMRAGMKHGFTWWLRGDGRPYHEEHYWNGQRHGIERMWNAEHRLRRGYPRYWVRDEQVSKREYLSARKSDPGLPPFRAIDQVPRRRRAYSRVIERGKAG